MNMQALLKQAQKMQKDVEKAEAELQEKEYESTMGGGVIRIVAKGNMEIQSITIDESLLTPEGKEDLEEMMTSAINEVISQVSSEKSAVMNSLTGGVKMPGGF